MPRRRKNLPPDQTPDAIARRNIERRLKEMFPKASGMTQRYELISKIAGMGPETVRMFMVNKQSMTLKNLISLAEAIGLSLPELFTDGHSHAGESPASEPPSSEELQRA